MRRPSLFPSAVLALALLSAACATAPSPPAHRKVFLLSLDGAGADELRRLWHAGVLSEGGFDRFFREGETALRLVNVNPTLTAPNHISLATGYPANQTGIVANTFQVPGGPFTRTVRGFDHTIGTETLWEAARRQGRRVAVTTFPGVDDAGGRRRADWGMVYVNHPDRPAELVELDASRGTATVELARGTPEAQIFELRATEGGALTQQGKVLTPGAWGEIPCRVKDRDAVCPVKLLEASPDLGRVRLYFNGIYPLKAYPPDFARDLARRGLYWPGEPGDLEEIGLETWTEQAERFARFFGDSLLAAAARPGWDLLMGYIPVIDDAGHELSLVDSTQPGFSPERRADLEAARFRVWKAVDREIARVLGVLDLRNTVFVLVSDHGMMPVHTAVDPDVLLWREGLLNADARGNVLAEGTAAYAVGSGGISHVWVSPDRRDLLPRLREMFTTWEVDGERPVDRIVPREDAASLQLDHPNSGDLILIFRPGYSAHGGLLERDTPAVPTNVYGMHGYVNTYPEMHGIFLALGGGVEKKDGGTMRTTEVAGRVAAWLGIEKPRAKPVE